ncbi:hypothetical protein HPB50_026192 [Hyalomma asiaticum]|uniref:Uncharacterized protein n=1 Tax=Hyalomma asiaticum TaxID=266040 RepID=A0ACB7TPP1_HYAAI|nr:hypothetical protein HPB50_026192 [Hyalomma asiaticum]
MDRFFKKKRKTGPTYGKRRRRTPNPRRSRERTPSRQSIAESDATLDPQSSRDAVNNAGKVWRRCLSSSEDDGVDATVHRREAAHPPNEEDRVVQIDGETGDGEMTDAPADAINQRGGATIVPGERHTIQGHIQPSFVSAETAEVQSTTVRESLGAMSATERKFALTTTPECATMMTPGEEEEYVMVQMGVLNAIIGNTLCPAGNVVTGEMVEELLLSGADIIKVGIGPGSVCTTRKKTGVGYPQLSAVIECSDAAHGLDGHIISDGGCTCPGDVSKAFGAGADFVMLGGMLAGHDESGGEVIEKDGKKYKMFYGMSSATAMEKYHGGVAEYRASEGKTVQVPYRGKVQATVLDILGGLRSACTYTGAGRLKELTRRTTFIRVTQQLNQVFSQEA